VYIDLVKGCFIYFKSCCY